MRTRATMIGIVLSGVLLILLFIWLFHGHVWQGLPHPEDTQLSPGKPSYKLW
ncbi:MAG: hypothetical protein K6T31_07505 [Alicyclobacillus sp.]|nr:hypothetical protein [Alicyclobacillus sp.]